MRKRLFTYVACILTVIAVIPMGVNSSDVGESNDYIPRAPFRINSNADFDQAHNVVNWDTGDGSPGNPWIIENWYVDGTGVSDCIYVGNTTDHFIIRDCYVHNSSGSLIAPYFYRAGIHFYNVLNGRVINNKVSMNQYGIYLSLSNWNTISNNSCILSILNGNGLTLSSSNYNTLYNNSAIDNSNGIRLYLSYVNDLISNNVSYNLNRGISLGDSDDNTLINNTAHHNNGGIALYGSGSSCSDNTLIGNTAYNNVGGGFTLAVGVSYNEITNNIAANNDGPGFSFSYADGNWLDNNLVLGNTDGFNIRASDGNIFFQNTASLNLNSGIYVNASNNNSIIQNTASANDGSGIYVRSSNNNSLVQNTASSNGVNGFYIRFSDGNSITRNNIIENDNYGCRLSTSQNNNIYHNNFYNNSEQASDNRVSNSWDEGYPSGGNYWSNYTGVDVFHMSNQDVLGSDGIGDTNYSSLGGLSVDRYPLMAPFEYTEYNISLQEGWNMVSLPVRQLNWSLDTVLESIDGVWDCLQVYDTSSQTWLSNNTHRPAVLNDLNEMNHFKAFWINITQPGQILSVRGDIFGNPIGMPLIAGWNLAGYPSLTEMSITDALIGTGYDIPVEGFNATAPYWIGYLADTYMMKPGEGYWVHVPADTVWFVDW